MKFIFLCIAIIISMANSASAKSGIVTEPVGTKNLNLSDPLAAKKINIVRAAHTYGIPSTVIDLKKNSSIIRGNTNICTFYCEGGCGPISNGPPVYTCYNVNYHIESVVIMVVDSYTTIPCTSTFGGCFQTSTPYIRSAPETKYFLEKCLKQRLSSGNK